MRKNCKKVNKKITRQTVGLMILPKQKQNKHTHPEKTKRRNLSAWMKHKYTHTTTDIHLRKHTNTHEFQKETGEETTKIASALKVDPDRKRKIKLPLKENKIASLGSHTHTDRHLCI